MNIKILTNYECVFGFGGERLFDVLMNKTWIEYQKTLISIWKNRIGSENAA